MKKFFLNQMFLFFTVSLFILSSYLVTVASAEISLSKKSSFIKAEGMIPPPVASEGLVVNPTISSIPQTVDMSWAPLLEKLRGDMPNRKYDTYFTALEPYSSAPMSTKVRELYTILTRPPRPQLPVGKLPVQSLSIYKGFVTPETVKKCKEFLIKNKHAFDLMEQRYHVPREVVVSLLYVETKLGTFLGKEKAFWSLACMAMADNPEMVRDGITSLRISDEHQEWLKKRLKDKSSWAYKELKALLLYSEENGVNPQSIPGSAYGAIGICQFMPSNIPLYGDDGTGNGKVDLFNEADAVVSVGKYFYGHGWQGLMTEDKKKKVIKRYNNLNRYANTILALASTIKTGKFPSNGGAKVATKNKNKKLSKQTPQKQKKAKSSTVKSSSQKKSSVKQQSNKKIVNK